MRTICRFMYPFYALCTATLRPTVLRTRRHRIRPIKPSYYPPEENPDEVDVELNDDTIAVYQYFEFLFDEVKRQEGLQFIVIEHAYLASNEDYKNAIVRRWNDQQKLIPASWPSESTDS